MNPTEAVPAPHRVCPWWLGYLLVNPLRRWFDDPVRLLGPHVKAGMTVLEVGPGMGFFSLPLARRVGERGRVLCLDVQERMIRSLKGRAAKAGLGDRIDARIGTVTDGSLDGSGAFVDFVLAAYVVHEISAAGEFLKAVCRLMKPGARFLVIEPKMHVSREAFETTVRLAGEAGLSPVECADTKRTYRILLEKR